MEPKQDAEKATLIKSLEERLRWYQEEATAEEMDVKEIDAILALLEQLRPKEQENMKTAEEAYALFLEQYLPEFEARTGEMVAQSADGKKKVRFFQKRAVRYTVMAATAVVLLFAMLNIGTYATAKKGFFEFLWQGNNGKSFFVTGESMENMGMQGDMGFDMNEIQECSSWDELPEDVLNQVMLPGYIPEEVILNKLWFFGGKYAITLKAFYIDEEKDYGQEHDLQIWIEHYEDANTWQQAIEEEAVFLYEKEIDGKKIFFYQKDEQNIAYFFEGEELYTVLGKVSLNEIEMTVKNLQYREEK